VPGLKLDTTIAGLILAAGESSRMGRDKALLRYRGRTFLETINGTLRQAGVRRITVVLGHHAEEIRRAVDVDNANIVINSDYRLGQTSSLQAGLRSLDTPEVGAILLCLVDHPAVSSGSLRAMIQTFRESGAPIIVPSFQGRRGHPVLISRSLFEELLSLDSSLGADAVIRRYDHARQTVEVPDSGILVDIDDPEGYSRLG
jgi:molybdenum cofactor cytidylyltransferase